jgi:arylmalonate decarboxylase
VGSQSLREAVTEASGLPATTMSNGVIDGLKAVGAKQVAVATAYNAEVNDRLRAFLIEHDLEPLVVTGLGIEHAARLVGRRAARRLERRGAGLREAAVARGIGACRILASSLVFDIDKKGEWL